MSIKNCLYTLEGLDLEPEVLAQFWKELSEDIDKYGLDVAEISQEELATLIDGFTDQFMDRAKRLKVTRVITKHNRELMRAKLNADPVEFLKDLPRQVEVVRDVIQMEGTYEINSRLAQMSDKGTKFKNGELDEDIYKLVKRKLKDPDFIHENKDIELGYNLLTSFDKWDLETQIKSGVAIEKLKDHLLKYKNSAQYLIEAGDSKWVADQKIFRNLEQTYGAKSPEEITSLLIEEYHSIIERKASNSERPNRLMYRGVVMKPGAVIMHNKLYGDGSIYASMFNTLKRTSNDSALQTVIPIDRAIQRGMDLKSPAELIDKIIADESLSEFEKAQMIIQLEKAAEDQTSPHILSIIKEIDSKLKELRDAYNTEGLNPKEAKKLDKQITYLENKGRALSLRVSLDPFVGREPTNPKIESLTDYAAETMNIANKAMTVPLLAKGYIAALFDVIPKYARNMQIWGDSPRNMPGNLWKSIKGTLYTAGHGTKVGDMIGATARKQQLAEALGMMLTEQDAFLKTLGIETSFDNLRAGDENTTRSALGILNRLSNLSFMVSGIEHMNTSSWHGSMNLEIKALNDALTGKLPMDREAKLYFDLGLTKTDIAMLSKNVLDNAEKGMAILNMAEIREKFPLLHHKLNIGMSKKAFMGTPRNDIRTERVLDQLQILGKKPLKGDSKIKHSLINSLRSLQKTGTSAILNTWELLSKYEAPGSPKDTKRLLNRITQALGVAMATNGAISVIRAAFKYDPRDDEKKYVLTDPQEFMRVFTEGMFKFEFLGIFRDLIFNVLSKNYYGAMENVMGPVYSRVAVAGQVVAKTPFELAQVLYGSKDWEDAEFVSAKTKYHMLKRSNVAFNIPFLEAITDEIIVEAGIGVLDPDGLEDYLETRREKFIEKQEKWQDETFWEYFLDMEE